MVNSSTMTQRPASASQPAEVISVLLIEDNPGDAFLIQGMLGATHTGCFQLEHVERLQDAISLLEQQSFNVILLDLSLPDSKGLQSLETLEQHSPSVPVVILTGQNDEAFATQAVHTGAQDYLVKGQVTQEVLARTIRYAIERQKSDEILRQRTLELEQANQDLQYQAQQLAAVNADLEAFNHTIAHDLRHPLAGIKTACALLTASMENQNTRASRYVHTIQDYSQQMGVVFEGLLQLAQLSHSPLQMQTVDLSATAQMIAKQLKTQDSRPVEIAIAPRISVQGDSRLLWMLLDHLLSNAWKFTANCPQPRIEFGSCLASDLSVAQKPLPLPDSHCVYFVKDNGTGFDMQHSDQVFAPFQQLVQNDKGQGIGLTMARCIANRHGGQLWCTAVPNRGATFYWTLSQPCKC